MIDGKIIKIYIENTFNKKKTIVKKKLRLENRYCKLKIFYKITNLIVFDISLLKIYV